MAVAAGARHSLGIQKDGTLWAWGRNFEGQLGDGKDADLLVPTKIGTDKDWILGVAGAYHTVARKKSGGAPHPGHPIRWHAVFLG
ncbi:MAG: hypothetical protein ACK4GB_00950 [Tepidimonas sp.]